MAKAALALRLVISAKTTIVSTCQRTAQAVAQALAQLGVAVAVHAHGRDLGINLSAGRVRRTRLVQQRLKQASHRLARVQRLVSLTTALPGVWCVLPPTQSLPGE